MIYFYQFLISSIKNEKSFVYIHYNQKMMSKSNCSIKPKDYTDYSFFPIKYPTLHNFWKKQRSVIWHPEHIDYMGDRRDWDTLDEPSIRLITFVLFFFSQADGVVNENLIENFKKETSSYKEARNFYSAQEFVETIHNETYSLLIEAFIRDEEEKRKGRNAIKNIPSIGKIYKWMEKWMNPELPLLERVVVFACVEGVIFSSAFAAIFWIKKRNKLEALCLANEWIARDEAIHTEFAIALYHVLVSDGYKSLTKDRIYEIVSEAVSASEVFIHDAIPEELIGLSADDMISYVKCTADKLLEEFGYEPLFNVENGCSWMVIISLPRKTNFFEKIVSEYAEGEDGDYTFDTNADY